ncbi:glycine betaine ABC transporter substrate-binding protein [Metabacillus arenae]|uniref:Glycine betaine ABC transporter substrate-binding protein n=1 Tax=Metabacillus arenae TaxID=2771434 RepID=A0A926NJZ6_9BACI|nr:glycine betaine ABC transporter substrate-binding protein [Metabacillus arenae]MBD1381353.1 glycine betaine ABC transporter substrate-binding protein [Metabacillus arenae]
MQKKISTYLVFLLIFSLILSGCGNNASEEEKKTIKIGMVNWIDNIATANLWKVILEEKGYEVNLQELDKAAMWTGIARSDIDITTQAWLPGTDKDLYEKYKNQVEIGEVWYENTKLGLAVPTYMENVNSVEDLNGIKEEINGEIIGIDPGSALMKLTSELVKDYQLDLDLVESSETAMLTELQKAYKDKKPIVTTLWDPHWIFTELDLKYLEEPKNVYGKPDNIQYLMRPEFKQDHKQVMNWMNTWQMDKEQLGTLIKEVEKASSPEEGAKKWVEENRDLVDSWVE